MEIDLMTLGIVAVMMLGMGLAVGISLPSMLKSMNIKNKVKRGFAQFHFIGDGYSLKSKWIKVAPEVTFEDKLYAVNNKFVVLKNRVPHFFYYEGDARPIDMLKRGLDAKMPPDVMSKAMILANLAGGINKTMDNKMLFYGVIGACALAGFTLAIVFNMSSNGVMCSNIGQILGG